VVDTSVLAKSNMGRREYQKRGHDYELRNRMYRLNTRPKHGKMMKPGCQESNVLRFCCVLVKKSSKPVLNLTPQEGEANARGVQATRSPLADLIG
jgi:hypothetical protein